jgi:hypothetical protein
MQKQNQKQEIHVCKKKVREMEAQKEGKEGWKTGQKTG